MLVLVSLGASFVPAAPRGLTRPPVRSGLLRAVEQLQAPAAGEENGVDSAFPYRFDGRLWFRPALARVPAEGPPGGVTLLSLFGWTVGGVVALEYDESPVGPYLEYVTMGALVAKRGTVGQWGSRLFVSAPVAEEVCRRVWAVPAELASIDFAQPGSALQVTSAPPVPADEARAARGEGAEPVSISVPGWSSTCSSEAAEDAARVSLPLFWTPSIKALWLPWAPLPAAGEALPLHRLRVSASSARVHLCPQLPSASLGVPLPLGLSVDGVRIEIGRPEGQGL